MISADLHYFEFGMKISVMGVILLVSFMALIWVPTAYFNSIIGGWPKGADAKSGIRIIFTEYIFLCRYLTKSTKLYILYIYSLKGSDKNIYK